MEKIINKEIINLKSRLSKLGSEKELWFEKKEKLKKEISELIKGVKEIKKNKDGVDKEIKKFKKERDLVNKEVKKLILGVKNLNDEFKGGKVNIIEIQKKIERLDMKIETEALSLTNEKKVMEEIKKLKKILDENKVVLERDGRRKNLNKEIDEKKQKAEELHRKVQENALKSQKYYEEFITFSKKINDMNKEQEEAFKRFVDFKKEFVKVNNDLGMELKKVKIKKEKIGEKIDKNMREKIITVEKN